MPQLQDTRKTLILSIDSIESSEVTLKDGLLAGDLSFVYGSDVTNDVERALRALSKMIVEWNLTDKDEKKLPITLENIKKLDIKDIDKLLAATSFGEGELDKKKEKNLEN